MENKFQQLFSVKKPIIGMIHLAGSSQIEIEDKVSKLK